MRGINRLTHYLTALTACAAVLAAPVMPPQMAHAAQQVHAYVESGLAPSPAGDVAVIVTAQSADLAARAVERTGGRVASRLWLINAVSASLPIGQVARLASAPGVISIVGNKGVRSSWKPVPQNDPNKYTTDKAWPVALDVGVDQLHSQGIKGRGITVAVLDSGVYFSPELLPGVSQDELIKFMGQIDFVDNGKCDTYRGFPLGFQADGYCFETFFHSKDGFGHGSHVAGIIGNRYRDAQTGVSLGIAPEAGILSIRVLNADGIGTYEDVIQGIQYVVENKAKLNVRVLNVSLSARASTPYFVDPLNRAVEQAWAAGIVVVAAAGNEGGGAETITVPGNDPYVITVGALNTQRTAGVWSDDALPAWSSTGPTLDGFAKPDVIAPGGGIVSFMYSNAENITATARLALAHPQYSTTSSLFRMSGTSMATAVAAGVVALLLQQQPGLTPDQVKYRIKSSARPAVTAEGNLAYSPLQQGNGLIWAPAAVLGVFDPAAKDNAGLDLAADLGHSYEKGQDLRYHYQGPVLKILSDQSSAYLYYVQDSTGRPMALGGVSAQDMSWLERATIDAQNLSWNAGQLTWPQNSAFSTGGFAWNGGGFAWNGGGFAWNGGGFAWNGGGQGYTWSGGFAWNGGGFAWNGGGFAWNGGGFAWNGGGFAWNGGGPDATIRGTRWVEAP